MDLLFLPILRVAASADLMLCVFPPWGLIVEISQRIPHLIRRGALLHIDRNGIIWMARAAVFEEAEVPLRRVAALIGRQRVLRRRICVCEISPGVAPSAREYALCV